MRPERQSVRPPVRRPAWSARSLALPVFLFLAAATADAGDHSPHGGQEKDAQTGAPKALDRPAPGALIDAPGKDLVTAHCGACHSLSLVTQNRGDADHWIKLIRWMQADHNLWDLGAAEADIVDYLATHYGAPDHAPRRAPLDTTWRDAGD